MGLYKKQIIEMEQYRKYRDLINVMLDADVKYELSEVDERLEGYLSEERAVK